MKKRLIITAAFMMACIAARGSLNIKTVKYDNLLVEPDINSNDSQEPWTFSTVRLVVNIIDINGTIINNEYCYGEPGTYTGLSQFYNPTGYELVGATDNGVKLDKIQAENLVVPEFLGNSSETIDYIVKPMKKKIKDEASKSKDDISTKNENKSTVTKQPNTSNVKNDTSNNEANENKNKNKNNTDKNDTNRNTVHNNKVSNKNKNKTNKNDADKSSVDNNVHKNDKADNGQNSINNGRIKKKSSDTKSLINSKSKEDKNKNNNQSQLDSGTLNHNINKLQPEGSGTGFGVTSKINKDKTNKYSNKYDNKYNLHRDQLKSESKSEPAKLMKSKLEKISKIISENNQQINSSIIINKSLIPYSLKDTKKIVAKNSTHNSQNSTKKASVIKKNQYLAVSGIVEVSVDKNSKELNNFKSKDNLPENKAESKDDKYKNSEKHTFRFEVPIVSMCITDDSNDTPNSKIEHPNAGGKSSFSINSAYIKSKGLLIITALMGIISALSLAIKPKK